VPFRENIAVSSTTRQNPSLARYGAWPRAERVKGNRIAFEKSGKQAMRSRTTDSLRLRYVGIVAISHESISIGNAGERCMANSAANRAIRPLSLCLECFLATAQAETCDTQAQQGDRRRLRHFR